MQYISLYISDNKSTKLLINNIIKIKNIYNLIFYSKKSNVWRHF